MRVQPHYQGKKMYAYCMVMMRRRIDSLTDTGLMDAAIDIE